MNIKDIVEKLEKEKENANKLRMNTKEFWMRKFEQGKMQLAEDMIQWIKNNIWEEK